MLPAGQSFLGRRSCFANFAVDQWVGEKVALRSVDRAGNLSDPGPSFRLMTGLSAVVMALSSWPVNALVLLCAVGLTGAMLWVLWRSRRRTRP